MKLKLHRSLLLLMFSLVLLTSCDLNPNSDKSKLNGVGPSQLAANLDTIKVGVSIEQYFPSPDGSRVALAIQRVRTYGFTLINLDTALATPITTTSQSIAPNSTLRWAPDGNAVAFSAPQYYTDTEHNTIYIYDIQAHSEVTVSVGSDVVNSLFPMWSSKGDSLYFVAAKSGSSDLMKVGRDGRNATKLFTLSDKADEVARIFAPVGDGQQFLITTQVPSTNVANLYLSDSKGENRRKLADIYRLNSLQVSPRNDAVLLEQAPDTQPIANNETQSITYTLSIIVPLAEKAGTMVIPAPPTIGAGPNNSIIASSGAATWSPDGDKIAYFTTSSVNPTTMLRTLMVAQADGSGAAAVYSTAEDIRAPAVLHWGNNDTIVLLKGDDTFAVVHLTKRQ